LASSLHVDSGFSDAATFLNALGTHDMSDHAKTATGTDTPRHLRPGYMPGGITGKGFTPGKSGNPKGRPKKRTLEEDLRRILKEIPAGSAIDKQEGIIRIWLDEIICKRNTRALIALLERLFPAPQSKDDATSNIPIKVICLEQQDLPLLSDPANDPINVAFNEACNDPTTTNNEVTPPEASPVSTADPPMPLSVR